MKGLDIVGFIFYIGSMLSE